MCGICGVRRLGCHKVAIRYGIARFSSQSGGAKPPVTGIPYSKLTIGVPKESWTNEKRYNIIFY